MIDTMLEGWTETEQGVAGRMFTALATAGINVRMITTSEIKISALVDRADAAAAVAAVHAAFGLETPTPGEAGEAGDAHPTKPSALEVVRRLGYRKTMPSSLNLGSRAEDWQERPDSPAAVDRIRKTA